MYEQNKAFSSDDSFKINDADDYVKNSFRSNGERPSPRGPPPGPPRPDPRAPPPSALPLPPPSWITPKPAEDDEVPVQSGDVHA